MRAFCLFALLALPLFAEDDKTKALETPEEAWRAFQKAAIAKEPEAVWNFWSKAHRDLRISEAEPLLEVWKNDKARMEEMSKMSGKPQAALKAMKLAEFVKTSVVVYEIGYPTGMDKVEFAGAEVKGKVAIVTMREIKDGQLGGESQTMLVLEDGRWKWEPDQIPVFDREEDGVGEESPHEAFAALKRAAESKDVNGVWGHFCPRSQKHFVETLTTTVEKARQDPELMDKISRRTRTEVADLQAMKPGEFVKMLVVADDALSADHLDRIEWVSTDVNDDVATLIVRDRKSGEMEKRVLVRSADKRWQHDVEATEELRKKSK